MILQRVNRNFRNRNSIMTFRFVLACPPGGFFYDGSCYFYLPPRQIDNIKGLGFPDVSVDEGVKNVSIDRIQIFFV